MRETDSLHLESVTTCSSDGLDPEPTPQNFRLTHTPSWEEAATRFLESEDSPFALPTLRRYPRERDVTLLAAISKSGLPVVPRPLGRLHRKHDR